MTNKQKYVLVAADAVVALAAPVFTVPVSTTAFAACTGNPHDHDSGPTGNPHDNGENWNSHDSGGHFGERDNCNGAQ